MATITADNRTKAINDAEGIQYVYKFPNGFGASVVKSRFSYGHREGKWELAVLDSKGHLTYETPITSDVIGHLSEAEVNEQLALIAALPKARAAA